MSFRELFSNLAKILPFETLSPILTFNSDILPEKGEGTSTLDLSLSKVTTGSFLLILSPTFTSNSMISTDSKSPISGTIIFWAITIKIDCNIHL